jgi:hypothetical protein
MPKHLYIPLAVVLIGAGLILNHAMYLSGADPWHKNIHMAAVMVGQMCWGAALFLILIRGDIYAEDHFSYDGFAFPMFNAVKWSMVAAFIFWDLFVLERVWEWYFIAR